MFPNTKLYWAKQQDMSQQEPTASHTHNNSITPKIARQHPTYTHKLVHLKDIQGHKRYSLYTLKVHGYQWVYY